MAVVGHFAVYDRKAGQYFPVFSARNPEVARRMIVQSFNKDSVLVQYPADYTLIHLSNFDDESGEIIALGGSFIHEVGHIVDLIPEPLQQYALDGSFKKN